MALYSIPISQKDGDDHRHWSWNAPGTNICKNIRKLVCESSVTSSHRFFVYKSYSRTAINLIDFIIFCAEIEDPNICATNMWHENNIKNEWAWMLNVECGGWTIHGQPHLKDLWGVNLAWSKFLMVTHHQRDGLNPRKKWRNEDFFFLHKHHSGYSAFNLISFHFNSKSNTQK